MLYVLCFVARGWWWCRGGWLGRRRSKVALDVEEIRYRGVRACRRGCGWERDGDGDGLGVGCEEGSGRIEHEDQMRLFLFSVSRLGICGDSGRKCWIDTYTLDRYLGFLLWREHYGRSDR